MANGPEPLERMDRLRPALDSYFKALGQAERFMKLVQQRAAARQTEARLTAEYQARQQPPESQQPESHPSELHGQAPATKPR